MQQGIVEWQKYKKYFLKCIDKLRVCVYNKIKLGQKFKAKKEKEVIELMNQDKTISCKDCGAEFIFTASEQDFFAEKGFTNEPQRCKSCRVARKNGGNSGQREMFEATCAECGCIAKVPFKPREDRPVYCSDCFSKQR